MFFALRDLRTARWRFTLITGVVLLLSVLVAGLLGLTAGLSNQSVSALRALGSGGSSFVLPTDDKGVVDLDRAALTDGQVESISALDPSAVPVGLARLTVDDGTETGVSAVAVGLAAPVGSVAPPSRGEVLVSTGVDDEVSGGVDEIGIGGDTLAIAGNAGDLWHSHTPVVVTDLDTWRELAPRGGAATTIAVSSEALADSAVLDQGLGLVDSAGLVGALPSHRAENTSLRTMTYMLLAVTALVVGAFFTVWGMQRRRDVAVLKALGASTAMVVRDSIGQAAIVLAVGIGGGVGIAALLGLAAGGTVPFVVSTGTTLLPAALIAVLGLAGAAASLGPVLNADPNSALGAAR
ncbi:FtsX-like permease family protein [Dietzia cinnamea]|uniref:FtsX-like permease family protein n=1 Tax=Dietzia cinnamea TaxID=321318 RepID=UPI00223ADF27|nr:FtsX-like permease family protein [Dietzia cinnamea]MCT2062345.1 ABC transporter permease [Dietzia cinnamea]MCT2237416.1 ABC transporter permease [Dietzia cinnamea]MCT2302044.1 ABC transporter permease [Dietzia cinnamea]